jgi:DNA-binding transcriptional ArsR family regulator
MVLATNDRQHIAAQLRPLAHASRLLVLYWVANNVVDVYHLSQRTELSAALVRAHLRALAALGYIEPFWRRHQLCYRVVSSRLTGLNALLTTLGWPVFARADFYKPSPSAA